MLKKELSQSSLIYFQRLEAIKKHIRCDLFHIILLKNMLTE
ncbi:hypothetical protein AC26_1095 [Escherichia coli 1-176-05_S3_C2]|nr:hypothetical protein AC26_1095 [Escherichia coli 1-176-05_S3_C2]